MKEGASTDAERGPRDDMGAELPSIQRPYDFTVPFSEKTDFPEKQTRLQTSQEKLYAHNPSTWEVERDQFKVSSAT